MSGNGWINSLLRSLIDFNMSNNQHVWTVLSCTRLDEWHWYKLKALHPKYKLLLYSRYVLSKLSGSGIPDSSTEYQPVDGCQIPGGYKLQRSTTGWNAAYLIYVRSKKIFIIGIWHVKKISFDLKFQRIILKSKRSAVSERKIFPKKEKNLPF